MMGVLKQTKKSKMCLLTIKEKFNTHLGIESTIFCNCETTLSLLPPDEMSSQGNDPNSSLPKPSQLECNLRQALAGFQNQCSGVLHNLSNLPPFNPPLSLKSQLQSTFSSLQNQAKRALDSRISAFDPVAKNPVWARIAETAKTPRPYARPTVALSTEAIEERLAGIPVYALSNASEEFVLVSGASTAKSLGLFCFNKEDAETLLGHIGTVDPSAQNGSKVVTVALNKVFQLHVNGVAFRLIPECSQVKNALSEREKAGISDNGFPGVPVFQSKSLILRSQNKSYRPAFFRKEDLENSLKRASQDQNQMNPALRPGDVQVAAFEDIIKGMKDNSISTWDDVVFIPPGFDVSTDPKKQH
ncbi:protein TIC 22-like, chloroplastic [Cucurbita moschata]|uniref:Protein TIC 22-like, chloroplastic n=1 Tax=Cucurbita moschata TaxID=3662 RepID=A0A6J1H7U6_CUCMO|nr:protein TIC 22-like, chloroplastic [Cucurbita moschata]